MIAQNSMRSGPAAVSSGIAVGSVLEATSLLYAHRHQLPPDVLRSLASIWSCASAARYGQPHERFWEFDAECGFYSGHDVVECEAGDRATTDPDITADAQQPAGAGCAPHPSNGHCPDRSIS